MASTTSSRGATSPRSSHSPALEGIEVEVEQPRKKGARGGKRSVTHLSKAQLARKRANDREAQRNIRQRTKEHIENLERKVRELEDGGRSSSVERIIRRNQELEDEVERLRTQLAHTQTSKGSPSQIAPELLIPQEVPLEWIPDQDQRGSSWPHPGADGPMSRAPRMPNREAPVNPYPVDNQIFPQEPDNYDEAEDRQRLCTPTAVPIWNDPMAFGTNGQQDFKHPPAGWTPFHPALSQPSRFADLNPTGFSEISTKLKAPVTLVDQLMFSVINSQRHLHITSDVNGEKLIGPEFPSVNILFNQQEPPGKPPSNLSEVMARYSAVLSNRGFALIPEKLASFMCMYRFIQWQISPDYSTFKALHDWQAPCPNQLLIAHPAWMDLPPWPMFRSKVIENQDRYDNVEFQSDYASNLSVNFPHDPMHALVFEKGQIMVSKTMDNHLSDIKNMSMKLPFALKYPEFRDVCRFDEVE